MLAQDQGAAPYLHGYDAEEQSRLYRQARVLEPGTFRDVDFAGCARILEVGTGVGAQTEILLERFPRSRITAVDRSGVQIEKAMARLGKSKDLSEVEFVRAVAEALPFEDAQFDGAFLCWILEHVQDPLRVLTELHRVLKPSAKVFCNEVFNPLFRVYPRSRAVEEYWASFNERQLEMGGNPEVGLKLRRLFADAGFCRVQLSTHAFLVDSTEPGRKAEMFEYCLSLLLSAAPELLRAGRVTLDQCDELKRHMERLARDRDGALFLGWVKVFAIK